MVDLVADILSLPRWVLRSLGAMVPFTILFLAIFYGEFLVQVAFTIGEWRVQPLLDSMLENLTP